MNYRRLLAATGVALVAAALVALPALGATPRQIYQDYADNGRLDAHYSSADLQNALHDATVQAYGSEAMKPAVIKKLAKPKPTVLAAHASIKAKPTPAPLATTKKAATLPFTGAELTLFVVVGVSLIACGVLLRLSTRKKVEA